MKTFPASKHEWLAAALRVSLFLFGFVVVIPPIWRLIAAPILARDERHVVQWRIEEFFMTMFGVQWFVGGMALAVAILLLSRLCRHEHPTLSQFGFIFVLGAGLFGFLIGPSLARAREKPVIYLYPATEMTVNVQLRYDGTFTHTIPEYPDNGWTVTAKPSGELIDVATGKRYDYLFWEGRDSYEYAMHEGFVVTGKETAEFLDATLSKIGLSKPELRDFQLYWLPRMEENPYNLIHFATDEYDRHVPIEVTPKPDTVIRVFMLFEALDQPIDIAEQKLRESQRNGFTVVEWGGSEIH